MPISQPEPLTETPSIDPQEIPKHSDSAGHAQQATPETDAPTDSMRIVHEGANSHPQPVHNAISAIKASTFDNLPKPREAIDHPGHIIQVVPGAEPSVRANPTEITHNEDDVRQNNILASHTAPNSAYNEGDVHQSSAPTSGACQNDVEVLLGDDTSPIASSTKAENMSDGQHHAPATTFLSPTTQEMVHPTTPETTVQSNTNKHEVPAYLASSRKRPAEGPTRNAKRLKRILKRNMHGMPQAYHPAKGKVTSKVHRGRGAGPIHAKGAGDTQKRPVTRPRGPWQHLTHSTEETGDGEGEGTGTEDEEEWLGIGNNNRHDSPAFEDTEEISDSMKTLSKDDDMEDVPEKGSSPTEESLEGASFRVEGFKEGVDGEPEGPNADEHDRMVVTQSSEDSDVNPPPRHRYAATATVLSEDDENIEDDFGLMRLWNLTDLTDMQKNLKTLPQPTHKPSSKALTQHAKERHPGSQLSSQAAKGKKTATSKGNKAPVQRPTAKGNKAPVQRPTTKGVAVQRPTAKGNGVTVQQPTSKAKERPVQRPTSKIEEDEEDDDMVREENEPQQDDEEYGPSGSVDDAETDAEGSKWGRKFKLHTTRLDNPLTYLFSSLSPAVGMLFIRKQSKIKV